MSVRTRVARAYYFLHHLWAIAIFRSWRILFFFALWATAVCIVNYHVHSLALQPTLLTVLGTVLGFVISFRTTTSYDRYNEARKLWVQVIYASRMFARTVWFHVPSNAIGVRVDPADETLLSECQAKTLLEKKTVINLLEAYAIAVKHYLRREDGIEYEDINPYVKFLPKYTLPSSISPHCGTMHHWPPKDENEAEKGQPGLECSRRATYPRHRAHQQDSSFTSGTTTFVSSNPHHSPENDSGWNTQTLLPAENPPDRSLTGLCTHIWRKICHTESSPRRPKSPKKERVDNVPLEISFYLSSYIAALEERNDNIHPKIEPPTMSLLHTSLCQLIEALTDMERIATTSVIYSKHLWLLTIIYCLLLPFQTLSTLGWLTVPGTVLACFMFFGFLVAGAEIENPFGYDKNDLNLKDFVHIIHEELHSMTSRPTPRPSEWVFCKDNNRLFPSCPKGEIVSPEEWLRRGSEGIYEALGSHVKNCGAHRRPA
ncbi:UPF0187-domain-containing protein [Pisolithus tinctorius]|uniref:Uncharacterized protein n=1 Tax=Pisolithus tinctorius Marx 270 TaxID=870435 RepID=A0A0C3PS88_PISTI|nr:UPF0187-domain-containing protein [Pisolithus tinctorius]KIO11499.1 hypothetical protein M404DRAFT_994244 [Pisolithus tinctorius Marx 270]